MDLNPHPNDFVARAFQPSPAKGEGTAPADT
jgi:hypothetical protein